MHFDYVTGVSAGSFNAAVFSLYDYGQEKEAVAELKSTYFDSLPQDKWEYWPTFILEPFWKNSIIDFSKGRDYLHKLLADRPFKKKVSWQAVDIGTSQVVLFDETTPMDIRNDAVLGSMSVPAILPSVEIGDLHLIDGGIYTNLALGDPIERCRDEGVSDENIIVDVLMCFD